MARNSETTRQWETLRDIDAARTGIGIAKLADLRDVHPRTIRRDLDALARAGFPLYEDRVNGTALWRLRAKPFRALEETGLALTELCALYFSRSIFLALTGAPFKDDVERALAKLERALPAPARQFLDRIPTMLSARTNGRKKQDEKRTREILARAVDASLRRRRIEMRYTSVSSQRTREYVADPMRLSYADGGIYLTAYVAEYAQMRTFAVERIHTLAVLDERFEPRPLPGDAFADSIGVYSGTPEPVRIEFDAGAAAFVTEREWHKSQEIESRPDRSVVMSLNVTIDPPLLRWILGFGPMARVLAPARLAQEVLQGLEEARARYQPRGVFEAPKETMAPLRRAEARAS
jgi:predicted DNA-binding transcriptional regulator YafY